MPLDTQAAMGEPLFGHTKAVNCIGFSPDENLLASGSDDQTLRLWRKMELSEDNTIWITIAQSCCVFANREAAKQETACQSSSNTANGVNPLRVRAYSSYAIEYARSDDCLHR